MADGRRNSTSKSHHSRVKESPPPSSNAASREMSGKCSSDILSKEEEYKRLNAELEAKTASLVKEAEMVMRGQEAILGISSMLDKVNTEDFLREFDDDDDDGYIVGNDIITNIANRTSSTSSRGIPRTASWGLEDKSETSSVAKPSPRSRPSHNKRPPTGGTKKATRVPSRAADDVAVPNDTFLTSLQQQFSDMSSRIEDDDDGMDEDYLGNDLDLDVIPQAAANMGSEAMIRFLKAKLRVMQEEVDRLAHENHQKEEEVRIQGQKLKEVEEERNRLTRTGSLHQNQIEKFKKQAEDAKGKSDSLENQLMALRKNMEQTKRCQKQQETSQSATEVRLNRALEEIEKYREQLRVAKASSKDSSDADKKKVDQLLAENKRLEKQKNELMAGFKKQMKLIDILKRQKIHIEAAKMLQFSEEEFVKALEWGS